MKIAFSYQLEDEVGHTTDAAIEAEVTSEGGVEEVRVILALATGRDFDIADRCTPDEMREIEGKAWDIYCDELKSCSPGSRRGEWEPY
jgi:hypothetical protein